MIYSISEKTVRGNMKVFNKKNYKKCRQIKAPALAPILLKLLDNWVFVGIHCTYFTSEEELGWQLLQTLWNL